MSRKKILTEELCNAKSCIEPYGKCKGKLKNICHNRSYSCIDSLSDEQLEYIFSDIDKNIYLNACPGSGKTEVIGIKVAHEIKKWYRKNQGMAVLTFTNSAEDEILNRVSLYLNQPIIYPHFVGTFTSWIHGYIANPHLYSFISGKEKIDKSIHLFDSDSYNKIALNYCTKYNYGILKKINPTQFYESTCHKKIIYTSDKEKQIILDELLKKDSWREKELLRNKSEFNKANLYTYEDVEHLTYKLLKCTNGLVKLIIKRFPVIFIDECQDLSRIQISILEQLRLGGAHIHLIGDLDQSIYDFRWVDPRDTEKYIRNKKYEEMKLTQNYRSCQEIVDVSGRIISREAKIIGKQQQHCEQPLRVIFYQRDCESEAIEKYLQLLNEENIDNRNSYIIVRNNTLRKKIAGDKSFKENPLESMAKAIHYFNNYKTKDDFVKLFMHAGIAINKIFFKQHIGGNKGNFYCPKKFNGDEWRMLIFDVIKMISSDPDLNFTFTWSEWKKNLGTKLTGIQETYFEFEECNLDLGRIRNGKGNVQVQEMFVTKETRKLKMNITTIHGAKGMSLDSVLFFSSYQSSKSDSGTFWRNWFDVETITEKNRLAYVSFSRAKHLLVLAIPKTKNSNNNDFGDVFKHGFIELQ